MGSDSAFGEPTFAAPMTAPAPLDAAIEAIDRWDSLPVTHRYDYEAANVIAAFRPLLAALSADKRLARAEAALREIAAPRYRLQGLMEDGASDVAIEGYFQRVADSHVEIARRYFQKEERP